MNDTHDVISAFLDDEPFDANELANALSQPNGRELLIDLVALRHVMNAEGQPVPVQLAGPQKHSRLRAWLPAAAVLVALAGGYFIGERRNQPAAGEAPSATRVVEAQGEWRELP